MLTTIGDIVVATTAGADARLAAAASVAAHATTSNIWGAREITLTGGAVTFTDIADAPYVGAVAWVKQNAAHIWTDGAVFEVQGNANYTAVASDWIRIQATTVSTFNVTIFKADGTAVAGGITNSGATTFLAADVDLNNTANWFSGPNTGSIGANGQVWLITATAALLDTAGSVFMHIRLYNGAANVSETGTTTVNTNFVSTVPVQAVVTLTGATTFTLQARDSTATTGKLLTTVAGATAANQATSITAVRLS